MSWLIWGLVGLLAGLVAYLAVPILVGPQLSRAKQEWLLNAYTSQAMTALDRGGLVSVSSSGVELVHLSRDGDQWQCTIDGTQYTFSDPGARMGRFHDKPFGLADGNVDRIVRAEDLAVAEADVRCQETKGNNRTIETNDGRTVKAIRNTGRLPDTSQVSFHYLPKFLDHSGDPQDSELIDSYVEHAYAKHGGRQLVDVMALIMAAGAGVGLSWFLADYAPGSAGGGLGGGVTVPIQVAAWALGVAA